MKPVVNKIVFKEKAKKISLDQAEELKEICSQEKLSVYT